MKTPQMELSFDPRPRPKVLCMSPRRDDIPELFSEALDADATIAEDLYRTILAAQPDHVGAAINLGTILFSRNEFDEAERLYRLATIVDPHYALASFNLGNVLYELHRREDAIAAYSRAIAIAPRYADAHYNLALAYESAGRPRVALRHWQEYVRLDPAGKPWVGHAWARVKCILAADPLSIVKGGRA